MSAVVLASYLPGEGVFRSGRHEVVPIRCRGEFGYWQGLATWWNDKRFTLLNAEHDVEVTDEVIDGLLACPEILCARMYPCHWASSGLYRDVFPARNQGQFVKEGTEWAERCALGCLKMTPESRIGPLEKSSWKLLENSVEHAVKRPFHLHWPPIPHHHW